MQRLVNYFKPFKITRIDKYLFKEFARNALIFTAIFTILVVAIELLLQLSQLLANENFTVGDIVWMNVLKIPYRLTLLAPFCMIMSCVYTLANLYKHNEVVAAIGAGVYLFRFALPIIVFGFCFAIFLILFTDIVVAPSWNSSEEIKELTKLQNAGYMRKNNSNFKIYGQGSYIWARYYDASTQTLTGVTVSKLRNPPYLVDWMAKELSNRGEYTIKKDGSQFDKAKDKLTKIYKNDAEVIIISPDGYDGPVRSLRSDHNTQKFEVPPHLVAIAMTVGKDPALLPVLSEATGDNNPNPAANNIQNQPNPNAHFSEQISDEILVDPKRMDPLQDRKPVVVYRDLTEDQQFALAGQYDAEIQSDNGYTETLINSFSRKDSKALEDNQDYETKNKSLTQSRTNLSELGIKPNQKRTSYGTPLPERTSDSSTKTNNNVNTSTEGSNSIASSSDDPFNGMTIVDNSSKKKSNDHTNQNPDKSGNRTGQDSNSGNSSENNGSRSTENEDHIKNNSTTTTQSKNTSGSNSGSSIDNMFNLIFPNDSNKNTASNDKLPEVNTLPNEKPVNMADPNNKTVTSTLPSDNSNSSTLVNNRDTNSSTNGNHDGSLSTQPSTFIDKVSKAQVTFITELSIPIGKNYTVTPKESTTKASTVLSSENRNKSIISSEVPKSLGKSAFNLPADQEVNELLKPWDLKYSEGYHDEVTVPADSVNTAIALVPPSENQGNITFPKLQMGVAPSKGDATGSISPQSLITGLADNEPVPIASSLFNIDYNSFNIKYESEFEERLDADRLEWDSIKKQWIVKRGILKTWDSQGNIKVETIEDQPYNILADRPYHFERINDDIDRMTIAEANELVYKQARSGNKEYWKTMVQMYGNKIAFQLGVFSIILLGITFGRFHSRKLVMGKSFLFAVLAFLAYYILHQLGVSIGKMNPVPSLGRTWAFLAPQLGNFIFISVSLYRLRSLHT